MFKLEEGWLTVLLMCVMLTVAGWGVAVASWAQGLWAAWVAGVVGVLVGLVLAKSRFKGGTATLFALIYGLFVVGLLMCFLLEGTWHERSVELVVRLNNFIYKAIFGGTSRDALPFPVFVSLIFWVSGVVGAWAVFRRGSAWPAVIPAGVGLLVNAYYYLGPAQVDLYLAVYLLLSLLLVARVSLFAREREWLEAHVAFNPEMRLDFLRAGLAVAVAGVVVGWAAPSAIQSFSAPVVVSAWQELTSPWAKVREQWMRLFANVRAYGQNVNDFYGDSLALGGGSRLSDSPIMDVAVGATEGIVPEINFGPGVVRYYWRMEVYDEYFDGRWQASKVEFREYNPKTDSVRLPPYRLRRDVTANILSFVGASSRLYTPAQPRLINRTATFQVIETPGGSVDVASVRLLAPSFLRRGDQYQAIGSLSVADQQSLRTASVAYPDWVTARFLQLPSGVTQRTRDLAQQIVAEAGATNAFDKADAITNWLRANITYDLNIDAPPADVDPVDYVLFTSRRGYCNYYASAMVVLLRSLDIPTRLAVGMAQGELDEKTGVYHILERNAHAWPEVFFPDYGWVEFEPTASESPLERPATRATASPAGPFVNPDAEDRGQNLDDPLKDKDVPDPLENAGQRSNIWLLRLQEAAATTGFTLAVVAVIAIIGVGLLLRVGLIGWESLGMAGEWVMTRRGLALPSVITATYMKLERLARWLGLKLADTLTPHERAAALGDAVPLGRAEVETITAQYVTEHYSPHATNPQAVADAWRALRPRAWKEALERFLRSWTEGEPEKKTDKKPERKWG